MHSFLVIQGSSIKKFHLFPYTRFYLELRSPNGKVRVPNMHTILDL
jgi:hypothetical protein